MGRFEVNPSWASNPRLQLLIEGNEPWIEEFRAYSKGKVEFLAIYLRIYL